LLIRPIGLMAVGISTQTIAQVGNSISNPMRPPEFALLKYQQEKDKKNPKTVAIKKVVVKQKVVKSKPLKLTSILYSSNRKIAIIDEKMLKVGEDVNGARLISIEKGHVHLSKNGKTIKLLLSNQSANFKKTIVQKTTGQKRL
jgi:hypothetical protein